MKCEMMGSAFGGAKASAADVASKDSKAEGKRAESPSHQ